jgi:hypothetical protein
VVHLVDDAEQLAAACRHVAAHSLEQRDRLVAPLRRKHEWDAIAHGMSTVLEEALRSPQCADASETA